MSDSTNTADLPSAQSVAVNELDLAALNLDAALIDLKTLDPKKHYRWVRRDEDRFSSMRARGWQVTKRDSKVKTRYDLTSDDGTGTIIHGDRILMEISKEEYEKRQMAKANLHQSRLKSHVEEVWAQGRQKGVQMVGRQSNEPREG